MLYQRKSFSVSSVSSKQNAPRGAMCAEKGHSGRDSRGRCYSCGERIPETPLAGRTPDYIIIDDVDVAGTDRLLAGCTHEYLDAQVDLGPAPHPLVDGEAFSIDTHEQMVNLEGGPLGETSVPSSRLIPLARTNYIEHGSQRLLYRAIGSPEDRPRVFTFDGFARDP